MLAFGTNRRSQSPRDPRDEGKARGRVAEVEEEEGLQRCHFQAGSLWSKALREKENKTQLHLLHPPLLLSMWRSACSAGRSATAGRGGAAAPLQNLMHILSAVMQSEFRTATCNRRREKDSSTVTYIRRTDMNLVKRKHHLHV